MISDTSQQNGFHLLLERAQIVCVCAVVQAEGDDARAATNAYGSRLFISKHFTRVGRSFRDLLGQQYLFRLHVTFN